MLLQLIAVLAALVAYLYYKTWKKLQHWSSMGIPEDPGTFLGSQPNRDLIAQKINFNDYFDESYAKFRDNKVWGNYGMFATPQLVINDLDLMKDVMIKDFDHFPEQPNIHFGSNKYVQNMLISLKGEKWKTLRTVTSPIFTSGKLKGMLPLLEKVGDEMVKYLEDQAANNAEFEAKELFTNYAVAAIATTGFGIESKSFTDPQDPFKDQVDKLIFKGKYENAGGVLQKFSMAFCVMWPKIGSLLKMELFESQAVNFFASVIKNQIKDRKSTGQRRNDFIDALSQGLGKGEKQVGDGSKIFQSQEELETAIVSNGLLLLIGGFDTSSDTAAALIWYLVKNPEVQEALYEEIKEAIEANDMSQYLHYDTIQTLPYLDGVVMEGLRLYPIGHLSRVCVKEYTFKDVGVTVKPGTQVMVPSITMMRDEKYYEDPLTFDPTRWTKENVAARNPYLHMTFGHGPRNCIGRRLAFLQNKMAIIRLVANFKVVECERTWNDGPYIRADPKQTRISPYPIWVKCVKRN